MQPKPSSIDARKSYLIKGSTLQALLGGRVIPGPGIIEKPGPDGARVFMLAGGDTGPAHPWKVSETGTADLVVASGSILFPQNGGVTPPDLAPYVYLPATYAGGTVEVTAASGYLYALASGTDEALAGSGEIATGTSTYQLTLPIRRPQTLSVVFSTAYPLTTSAKIAYLIAEVAKADGIASVVTQHLYHNPTHDLVFLQIETD